MPILENLETQGNYLFKYRGILPLFIVVPGLIIAYESQGVLNHMFNTLWHKSYELICLAISFIGFYIRIITVGHTSKGTSGRNTKEQIADKLNTTGMYSIVRHPLYLGNYLMWLGICLRTFNVCFTIIVSLLFWIYYERIMFAEEKFLRNKFGDEYLKWADGIPTFFPAFRKWIVPTMAINYKKILRQEKTGFLVMFVLFFAVEIVSEPPKHVLANEWYWPLAAILSLIMYVVVKWFKVFKEKS